MQNANHAVPSTNFICRPITCLGYSTCLRGKEKSNPDLYEVKIPITPHK